MKAEIKSEKLLTIKNNENRIKDIIQNWLKIDNIHLQSKFF
jgi:hypothetical protein